MASEIIDSMLHMRPPDEVIDGVLSMFPGLDPENVTYEHVIAAGQIKAAAEGKAQSAVYVQNNAPVEMQKKETKKVTPLHAIQKKREDRSAGAKGKTRA